MSGSIDRTESIFIAAVALASPVERAAFVQAKCDGDPDLQARVEALLRAHDKAGHVLDRGVTGDYERSAEQTGTVIAGRYKLLEEVGEGGMGVVWIAEQTEPVKRKVALKLVKAGMDSRSVLARFEAERQALAMMDHPNIAKVLDGGLTSSGRPFFVMEFVKGVPITEYCDVTRLGVSERLQLFMQVCSAVQHAHQKGIIHRDLKPSNILVAPYDDKPVPKVIDFGLAKAMHQALTERTLHTAIETVLGTPLYMSPEQAQLNNLDVDTRTDVYSLGVLLYELLTGTTPLEKQRFRDAAWDEIRRLIREEEPPRPSARLSSTATLPSLAANRHTEPARLTKLIRGDLDWIVMKALEKDRNRRYETANGFAMDLQRYLAGEAVLAAPPTSAYRLRKFVRRNRGQVIAASLVFFSLVAGLISASYGFYRADLQKQRAEGAERSAVDNALKAMDAAEEERKAKAEAQANEARAETEKKRAIEFREKALDALRATTGTDVEQLIGGKKELGANEKAYLEAIAKRWQAFAKQEGTDEQARAIRAEGHYQVAFLWAKLGRREEARPVFEQSLAIWEKLAADFPAMHEYRGNLATSHDHLGTLLAGLGKKDEAEVQHKKARAIQEKLVADFPTVPNYRRALATSHNNLGTLLAGLGKRAESEEQFKRALVIQEKLAADFSAVPDYRSDLAANHYNLGLLMAGLGKRAEAEKQFKQALAIREKLVADFPTVPGQSQHLALNRNNLGRLLAGLGKWAEAEEQYNKALVIQEKLVADFPTVPDYRRALALSHNDLGNLQAGLRKRSKALEQYKRALVIQEKLAADFPAVPDYRNDQARSLDNLGVLLAGLAKQAEAEEQHQKALVIQEKLAADFPAVPEYRNDLARCHNNLGTLLAGLGKLAEAEKQFMNALVIREELAANFPAVPDYLSALGVSYSNFGTIVHERGRTNESLGWYDKAVATLTLVHRAEPRDVKAKVVLRDSYWNRARAYDQLQKYAEAVKDWDRAIELSPPAEQADDRASRATSRLQAGQVTEAMAEVAELTKSPNWNAGQWYNFACIYAVASGKFADKKPEYADRAMELLQKAVLVGYKDTARIKKDSDLEALREREDFKKLLAELEKHPTKEKP